MTFAERNGFESPKNIQLNSIDNSLRNRLYNLFWKIINTCIPAQNVCSAIVDRMGYIDGDYNNNSNIISMRFLGHATESKWYDPYTLFEFLLEEQSKFFQCQNCKLDICSNNECNYSMLKLATRSAISDVLEQEKSGYRLIDDKFISITNSSEIKAIEDSISVPYLSVRTHMKKALEKYSSKDSPDYENSIKESISAVEAMCCIITDTTGAQATLGNALNHLENAGITIHPAMKGAFSKLYGYTCAASGIRHGGIDFTNAPAEDAKYMLVACSAFINYLIEKYGKIGG